MVAAFADDGDVEARARHLRDELLEAGERELHSYEPVLEALALPAGSPERAGALRRALSHASQTPLAIARSASEVAELAARVTAQSKPALRGDATASVLLAESATRAAARLVEINLSGQPGDPRVEEVARLSARAAQARAAVLEIGPEEA
jgi:formiminotetrahydrofolate cyclodeaminase